ncbi:MAG: hypothetical protein M1818_002111 [Claussenomyces sp. TS43310]|nr:MAG: hypothetical protein M1818_002111 [Claussenomyces sp. TS43310]
MTYNSVKSDTSTIYSSYGIRSVQNSCAYFLPSVEPNSRILDVGCGGGTITCDMAAIASLGHVTGLDVSEGTLETARAEAQRRGSLDNITFVKESAYDLTRFDDDTFDIVHAHQVLLHLMDPVKALREFRRVCKPGGLVACRDADMTSARFEPDLPGLRKYASIFPKFVPRRGAFTKTWALEAGFDEKNMITSIVDMDQPSHLQVVSDEKKMAELYPSLYVVKEEMELMRRDWEEWSTTEGSYWILEAYQIVCRKF